MAYFSSGTEGLEYQERYCSKCIHDEQNGCPIWLLQLMWNNDAALAQGPRRTALELFIPRSEDGLSNEQCKMFVEGRQ